MHTSRRSFIQLSAALGAIVPLPAFTAKTDSEPSETIPFVDSETFDNELSLALRGGRDFVKVTLLRGFQEQVPTRLRAWLSPSRNAGKEIRYRAVASGAPKPLWTIAIGRLLVSLVGPSLRETTACVPRGAAKNYHVVISGDESDPVTARVAAVYFLREGARSLARVREDSRRMKWPPR